MKDNTKKTILVIAIATVLLAVAFYVMPQMQDSVQANLSTPSSIVSDTASSANILFTETGLPSGASWTISGQGLDPYGEFVPTTTTSKTATIEMYGIYAQGTIFSYSTSDTSLNGQTYTPTVTGGSLTLAAQNNITIHFTQTPGNLVTFNMQGGLPGEFQGLAWKGFLTNNNTIYDGWSTPATTFSINLPNGTYYFQINGSAGNYEPSIPNGYFTLNGNNYTLNFKMSYIYVNESFYVSFVATGITNGTAWNVTVGNTTHLETSNQAYVLVTLGYTYNLSASSNGTIYTGPKTVYLYTFNQQVNIQFQANYSKPVNFLATGLGLLGVSVMNFWTVVFLVAAAVSVVALQRFNAPIYFTALIPVIIIWGAYAMNVIGILVPAVIPFFAAAAIAIHYMLPGAEAHGGRPS